MPTSTLSGEAERPQVAGAVIEAIYFNLLLHLTFLAQRLHRLNAVLGFQEQTPDFLRLAR